MQASPPVYAALKSLQWANEDKCNSSLRIASLPIQSFYLEPEAPQLARWAWASGGIARFKNHTYLFAPDADAGSRVPPAGLRSAPPLGGLATGTVELRADGSMRSWTIENASPAGSTKTSIIDEALIGVWLPTGARALRTHPPPLIRGVSAMGFSGSMPFSRLSPEDAALPSDLNLTLYGRSRWRLADMQASSTPAIAFTLTVDNPRETPVEVSLLVSLPLPFQKGMVRPANGAACLAMREDRGFGDAVQDFGTLHVSRAADATECYAACKANVACAAWSFDGSACQIHTNFDRIPPAHNCAVVGAASGVRGDWGAEKGRLGRQESEDMGGGIGRELGDGTGGTEGAGAHGAGGAGGRRVGVGRVGGSAIDESGARASSPRCLSLERVGTHAQAGSASLCGSGEAAGLEVSVGAAADLSTIWTHFSLNGSLDGLNGQTGPHGAVAVKVRLEPMTRGSASVALGWRFPFRDFMGATVGNYYAGIVRDSASAARLLLDDETSSLDIEHWSGVSSCFIGEASSLPRWLGDSLLNSLHHTRSSMWLADGRWRQWESFSCVNVDSVHNDGERHVPYLMLWPASLPSKMRAWGDGAISNGMVQEQLACGCFNAVPRALDTACGRRMADVSAMYITYLLELWQWTADGALVKELWPVAKRAALWQMDVSKELGVPFQLQSTYDGLNLQRYNATTYNSMFHMLAMKAAAALARSSIVNDAQFAESCDAALERARSAVDQLLWNEAGKFYRSYTGADAIMADALYPQVLSDSLGLGPLDKDERVLLHLEEVLRQNDSPFGLLVQTGRRVQSDKEVWNMANPNWATLSIWRRGDVARALGVAAKTLDWWRSVQKDMWNVPAVTAVGSGTAGLPWANSHYGYHMTAWHIVFALSGQQFDAPTSALSFSPKLPPPFELPFMVPNTVGVLRMDHAGLYTLLVKAGRALQLAQLRIDDAFVRFEDGSVGETTVLLAPLKPTMWRKEGEHLVAAMVV
mmetsp:Transcript_31906/g.67137  ORF Transcript_31906/g.67137 Transcript_31906/m.67137 type:complete len:982 (+) Transcript_31906:283-3228(+)